MESWISDLNSLLAAQVLEHAEGWGGEMGGGGLFYCSLDLGLFGLKLIM